MRSIFGARPASGSRAAFLERALPFWRRAIFGARGIPSARTQRPGSALDSKEASSEREPPRPTPMKGMRCQGRENAKRDPPLAR